MAYKSLTMTAISSGPYKLANDAPRYAENQYCSLAWTAYRISVHAKGA